LSLGQLKNPCDRATTDGAAESVRRSENRGDLRGRCHVTRLGSAQQVLGLLPALIEAGISRKARHGVSLTGQRSAFRPWTEIATAYDTP
jgi:hypothetical protein